MMRVFDIELLEVVKCSRLEPVFNIIELAVYAIVIHVYAREVEATAWTWVVGEDLRDDGDTLANISTQGMISLEVERRGVPEVAPPAREGLCAGAILGGEEGDDDV
jgi:hypothetical protein